MLFALPMRVAAAATAAPAASTPQPVPLPSTFQFAPVSFGSQHPALLAIIEVLFVLTALGLVALMSVQTTKSEGLSGTIGGRTESAYRGRLGFDEQLARLTNVLAIAFVILAISYYLVTR
jgi:preprotein translocase subunit SecG